MVQVHEGVLVRVAPEPGGDNWLLTGSSRGHLTLWDMRFQLPINSWQHPQKVGLFLVLEFFELRFLGQFRES